MAKTLLREKAIQLRKLGYTYSQIKEELNLEKSTLSDWLRNLPLADEQLAKLARNKQNKEFLRREKYIITRRHQREERLRKVYEVEKNILPLSKRELFLSGIFLYWGEGEKTHGIISVSNSDPRVIKFAIYWMVYSLGILKSKIKVSLHLYKDMNIAESIEFWSKTLRLPNNQFKKPYIKKSNREGLTYKSFGHGTCRVYFSSVLLSEKVAMSIKAISDKYGAKSNIFWYN